MGALIGKRRRASDSLQYIISLLGHKESDAYVRVKIDTHTESAEKRRSRHWQRILPIR